MFINHEWAGIAELPLKTVQAVGRKSFGFVNSVVNIKSIVIKINNLIQII